MQQARQRKPQKSSFPIGLVLGGVVLVGAIVSYFIYSSWEKGKYINETLGFQTTFSVQVEKGEFQKGLVSANAIQSRFDARANIFSVEQKTAFADSIKKLKRQIEIQEILEKLSFQSAGENGKSLIKISNLRKELNGKIISLTPEMNSFLLTFATNLNDKIFEVQKDLLRGEYNKADKEWEKLANDGKFNEAAKQFRAFIDASKDPADVKINSFIEKSFPITKNKYEIQNKTYEEALAIYQKGIEGNDAEYAASISAFDAFAQKVPLEYTILKKELKSKLSQLKSSQRGRFNRQINSLSIEKPAEKKAIEDKAFSLEMPTAPKVVYSKSSKQELEKLSSTLKSELPFFTFEKESINEAENNVLITGKEYSVQSGIAEINNNKSFMIEINGVRLCYDAKVVNDRQLPDLLKYILNHAYETARKIKLIDEACDMADQNWSLSSLSDSGLGLIAESVSKDKVKYLLIQDKLFKVDKQNFERKDAIQIIEKFRSLVKELSSAISQNTSIDKEVAKPLILLVSAVSEKIDPNHFLTNSFAQLALVNDYFEKVLPNCPADIADKSKKLKEYYQENIAKLHMNIDAKALDGSETIISSSLSGFKFQWMYDKERDETAFIRIPKVIEMDNQMNFSTKVGYATIYKGKFEIEPTVDPIRLEARHITGGILAIYDYTNKKFMVDEKKWNRHILTVYRMPELYGAAYWAYPPHILNLDTDGNIKEMFVPNGRFALPDFSQIKNEDDKLKAKNEWLDNVAGVLKSSGELHLLFKYFAKYVFDSPLPNMNNIIGNNNERGDFHQTVYQTIERSLGKKMLCDCDDLAEVYSDITRRQGKTSYVMAVPGHATCGWIEKTTDGYAMNFLDTGQPRRFVDKSLDMAIEKGVKAYDQKNMQGFNARAVAFLFRFAGEQVRQGYYLDSKVFTDPEYGNSMVKVQESWHFHYFLQGAETMEGILNSDKASANYFEIAGLYREMGVFDQAIKLYKLGLDQLDKADEFGYIQSTMTYINYNLKGNPTAVPAMLKENEERLKKVNAPANSKELVYFDMANYYNLNKKPIEAYRVIEKSITDNPRLNERLVGTLNNIINKLNEKIRSGQVPTEEEKAIIVRLDKLVMNYYSTSHFTPQDDAYGCINKYNGLLSFYIGKYGWEECVKKLKEGKFPSNLNKNHVNRSKATEAEDWDWIRLNLYGYYGALFKALQNKTEDNDELEPIATTLPSADKWKDAMQFEDLMEKVYKYHEEKGFGKQSLYIMLLARMLRGVVEKNDKLVDETLDTMKKDAWTPFDRMVADSISGMSDLVPKEDFMKLFNKYSSRNPPKQHFMGIAYKAFFKKKYDIALAVAEATALKFKDDSKMQKELLLLRAFVVKQKAENPPK
jgi:hypothetical protein